MTDSDETSPDTTTPDLAADADADADADTENAQRPAFDIALAFKNKQTALEASFTAIRHVTSHPGTKGDVLEADWVGLIRDFLPTRYEVGPIFAVDHTGTMSEQIDVAVYDKHFSPQWFGGANGVRFVPAESVYAVFEIKPNLNKDQLAYASQKVRSVRTLRRTSAPVIHKGGKYASEHIATMPIIGGILTNNNDWTPETTTQHLDKYLPDADDDGFLNIGIALDSICFDYTPTLGDDPAGPTRTLSRPDDQLIHFAIRLFRQLQAIGSVPSVDMERYEQAIYESATPAASETSPKPQTPT